MIKCFVCSFDFESPQKLCEHLKAIHQLSGMNTYKCTICGEVLTDMWKYRRHLILCEVNLATTTESFADKENNRQNDLLNFESKIHSDSLEFVCKLAGNMNIPRNYVFELMQHFRSFYSAMIADGFSQYVKPYVSSEQKVNLNYLMQILDDPFKRVHSEYQLDKVLIEADLIRPLARGNPDESEDVSGKESVTIMPLEFQFKKFFELPNVFEETQKYAKEASKWTLGHFINGEVWKKKLKSFNADDIVIPYHLHTDDVQMNNTLGSHRKRGLETCTYYSFPTVPPEYNSRLENIFVAQIFSTKANEDLENTSCYKGLIQRLNDFARNGIMLNINGKEQKVYFVLGLSLGDNKGVNDMCGFAKSHRANYFCRFCRMHRNETETAIKQIDKLLRTIRNYDKDVKMNDFKKTGITEESIINLIDLCHVTDSIGVDTMHDILEGILHYHLCEIIIYFISKEYFSLDLLNQLKFDFLYSEDESNQKSPPITLERLKAKKLLMSASEMNIFSRNFVFIIGDLVEKSDPVWKFYLKTMEFVELMDLSSYTEDDLKRLTKTISGMNRMYKTLFDTTLKPKHHFITHYPTLIRRYGPLRFISSMRFEAKHRFMKNYSKNTTSRIDLSYSLARKMQYNFASYLLKNPGLQDNVVIASSRFIQMESLEIFGEIEKSEQLTTILSKKIKETKKVTINGVIFSTKLYIPVSENSKVYLLQIMKIVHVSDKVSDVFLICKVRDNVTYNKRYRCYEVNINISKSEQHLKLISAVSALKGHHQRPISIHLMRDNVYRFRTKPF